MVVVLSNVRILAETYKFIEYEDWCQDLYKDCKSSQWRENLNLPKDAKDGFSGKMTLISNESFKSHLKE
jgi:hypothetical protein